MDQASMYELTVLTVWRGLEVLVPLPGAAASRVNGTTPRVFLNSSCGSFALNGMFAASVPPCARPNVWSKNWAHVHTNWLTLRSLKMFWSLSLKMRSLMTRGLGPLSIVFLPSAKCADVTRG